MYYSRALPPIVSVVLVVGSFTVVARQGQRGLTESEYTQAMTRGLEVVRAKLEPLPKHRLKFSGNLFFAHGAFIKQFTTDTLLQYVDALAETGAQRIDINPGVFPFRSGDRDNIAKYDRVIERIRRANLELAINPEPNRGELRISTLGDWERECLALYADLARRYRPDVFVLIHEPTTMAKRMGIEASPKQWRDFVARTAAVVKHESPATRLAAGGLAHEMEYLRQFAQMKELDLLSVNLYNLGELRRYNDIVAMARRSGKRVYIGETWRPPFTSGPSANLEQHMTRSLGDEKFQDLDAQWLDVIAMYASVMNMEALTAFWTTSFFAYVPDSPGTLDSGYNARAVEALQKGRRTSAFTRFKQLVDSYRDDPSRRRRPGLRRRGRGAL